MRRVRLGRFIGNSVFQAALQTILRLLAGAQCATHGHIWSGDGWVDGVQEIDHVAGKMPRRLQSRSCVRCLHTEYRAVGGR